MTDYTRERVDAAVNHAADLIQEQLDQTGDALAWDVANFVVNATLTSLENPAASLLDVFIDKYGAEDDEDARSMAEARYFLD